MGASTALWHARVCVCACIQINTSHNRMQYWGQVVPDRSSLTWIMKCIPSCLSSGHDKSNKRLFCPITENLLSSSLDAAQATLLLSLCFIMVLSPLLCCGAMILSSFTRLSFLYDSGVRLAFASFVPQQEMWGWTLLWHSRRLCSPHVICREKKL